MKKLLLRWLLAMAPSTRPITELEAKARTDWLLRTHDTEGFKAYYQTRYHGILAALAGGVEKDSEYYVNIGRRLEMLHLLAEAKREHDLDTKQRSVNKE